MQHFFRLVRPKASPAVLGLAALVTAAFSVAAPSASADIANFDIGGKIYTKWLYWNNDSQGVLNWGNPFWKDEYALGGQAGDNGVGSEFELNIKGRVSRYVEAGVRIKSRFGSLWQDWWENGDMFYDEHNTSGQSLGMNHAEYMKLRGYYIQFAPQIPGIDMIRVGSSDMGMFNEWTIGRIRYIDRDNGKGFFVMGNLFEDQFRYHLAVIALPRLWVGPNWSTGIGDTQLETNPFYSQDYAYGVRFDVVPDDVDWLKFSLVSVLTNDMEFNLADPDAFGTSYETCQDELGNPIPGCSMDHAVDWESRYLSSNTTAEFTFEPLDWLNIHVLEAMTYQRINETYMANGVIDGNGMFPLIYKTTSADDFAGLKNFATRARVQMDDPFEVGLSFKLEYFNIGEDFNAIFGARRESDVLLTDGFIEGGQLPTLNLANEFVDFDEPWVESCIGWHGATALVGYELDGLSLELEGTFITYNTNSQLRRTQDNIQTQIPGQPTAIYPNFLHTDGYTDTDLYDYANRPSVDRGRDPRSVYHVNQDRQTIITMLKGGYLLDVGRGLEFKTKFKFILDSDGRSKLPGDADDYAGKILTWRFTVAYPLTDGLNIWAGTEINKWWEDGRKGNMTLEFDDEGRVQPDSVATSGYFEDVTTKYKAMAGLSYRFEGVEFKWMLEYIDKKLDYGNPDSDSLKWQVWRSKAALEVAW